MSKKRLWHWCFPVNFAKFLRLLFLAEHLRWPLLYRWIFRNTWVWLRLKECVGRFGALVIEFVFNLKLLSFSLSRYSIFFIQIFHFPVQLFTDFLSFCRDLVVIYQNGLIKKIRSISNFLTSQPGLQTIAIQILPNIPRIKGNKTMKFGQLIKCNMRNIFRESHAQNVVEDSFLNN